MNAGQFIFYCALALANLAKQPLITNKHPSPQDLR